MDRLSNSIRAYPWGSVTGLPRLLGIPETGEPQAEMWVGAHERAPSRLERGGRNLGLDTIVAEDPEAELGPALAAAALAGAGRLPFLAKLLAVDRPLSLQVHPDERHAARGYLQEEAAGLAVDAGERSFPDPCAKPEMLYALSDFRALSGFRDSASARDVLDRLGIEALRPVREALGGHGSAALHAAFGAALRLPSEVAKAVIPALRRGPAEGSAQPLAETAELAQAFPEDPAVIAALLLHGVRLRPGETLYVPPGQPHCYLSGLAAEIQANSDNVLRAGLTSKHVDLGQVLRLVDPLPCPPSPVPSRQVGVERVYEPGVAHFALAVIDDAPQGSRLPEVPGPAVLLCLRGDYLVDDGEQCRLRRGEAAYVSARSRPLRVEGAGLLLRVTAGRAG